MQMTLNPERRHHHSAVIKAVVQRRNIHCPLDDSDARIFLKKSYERRKRIFPHDGIVVQEHNEFPRAMGYAKIIAAGKSQIIRSRNIPDIGIMCRHLPRTRLVGIIDDDNLWRVPIHGSQGIETSAEEVIPMPGYDYNG